MASYSDVQIARFLRIDPMWKPPVLDNRYRYVMRHHIAGVIAQCAIILS